jgi:hypothetical protein
MLQKDPYKRRDRQKMGRFKNVEWTLHLPPLLAAPPLPLLAASWRLYGVARCRPLFPRARPGPLPPRPPPRPSLLLPAVAKLLVELDFPLALTITYRKD